MGTSKRTADFKVIRDTETGLYTLTIYHLGVPHVSKLLTKDEMVKKFEDCLGMF